MNSYLSRLKDSVFSVKDAANDEPPWDKNSHGEVTIITSPQKVVRGSSAGSAVSSQDEGIHSTGEKEEDDINDEELTKENEEEGQQDKEEEEEETSQQDDDDEGRGSMSGEKEKESETEEEENENLDAEENEANEEAFAGYVGDSEDTPSDSILNETYLVDDSRERDENEAEVADEDKEDGEEETEENTENDENTETEEKPEEEDAELDSSLKENENKDENSPEDNQEDELKADEAIPEEPTIAKLPGTKKKKRGSIDMAKVNANRKPISIRTTPLPVPVSSKKENKNLKPHLKMPSYRNVSFKKPPKSFAPGKTANSIGNKVPEIISEENLDEDAETGEFLNPHMDHSLKRPKAPYKSKVHKTTKSCTGKSRPGAESRNCEVFVPEENKLYVYTYSSVPRILHVKRLGKKVSTSSVSDTDPKSTTKIRFR